MKTKTLYVCEFCYTSFSDEKEAKKCEASHKVLRPKTKIVPLYKRTIRFGVPAELSVEFIGDGEKPKKYAARYVLDCVNERSF